MKDHTLTAIQSLIRADSTIDDNHRKAILKACHSPVEKKRDRLLSSKQAADVLGCCKRTVLRYAERNQLHPIRRSQRHLRFRESEVLALAYGAGEVAQ